MRRVISTSAILITVVALMTSILIPHHHHEDEVCYTVMHNSSECTDHGHSDADHKHCDADQDFDAEGAEDHHNCLMDIEVIVPSNHTDIEKITFTLLENLSDFDGNAALAVSLELQKLNPSKILAFSPLLLQQYTCIASYSLGLRAPPSC